MKELMYHTAFKKSKIIKLLGYSNGNKVYDKAKKAIEKGWPALNDTQKQECLNKNHWLGIVISDGYIVVDIDNKRIGKAVYEGLLRAGYSFIAIETPNGFQFTFRDTGRVKNQGAKRLTLGGITVDFRLAKKGYIVLPTPNTEGRKVLYLPDKDLEPMPLFFLPVRGRKETDEENDKIYEGSRTTTFISHASKIREWNIAHNLNLTLEEKRQVLSEINKILCYPQLEEQRIDRILQSAESYQTISNPKVTEVKEVTVKPLITDQELIPICPFPSDIFPRDLLNVIKRLSESLHVEPELIASTMLTIISGAIGNTLKISPKYGYEVAPFLWLIIIANSGYGKSPIIQTLLKHVKQLQAKAYQDFQSELKTYEKQLRKAKQDESVDIPEKPKLKHRFVSDCTVEALAIVFENDGRGVNISLDEIAGLIFGFNQYKGKGNDGQHYNELFNCEPWKIDRKSEVKFIHNTGASIIGGIQPKVMPKVFNTAFFDDGFIPRFLMINAENRALKFSRQAITEETISYWIDLLNWCYEIPLIHDDAGFVKPKVLILNDRALNLYEQSYNDYGYKMPYLSERAKVFIPKLIAYYSLKFAGVLHAIRAFDKRTSLNSLIDDETTHHAIELTHYFAGQAIKTLKLYEQPEDTLNEFQKRLIETLYNLQDEVKVGKLALSRIREVFNSALPQSLTSEKVSSLLRDLGLTTEKSTGNYSYLLWESEKIQKLFSKTTVTTVTTVTNKETNSDATVTEVTVNPKNEVIDLTGDDVEFIL